MLHIILTILKIAGILLLVIFCLVLLIVICLLFAPVRYYGNGIYNEKEKRLHIKAGYLMGIVRVNMDISENAKNISFRILCKDMLKENGNKNKKKVKDNDWVPEKEGISDKDVVIQSGEAIAGKPLYSHSGGNKVKKHDLFYGIKSLIKRIADCFRSFFGLLRKFFEKLGKINERKNQYIEFLSDERSKTAFKEIKKIAGNILKHIRPRKITGSITFGTDSPDKTGQILGFLSVFTSGYFRKIRLNADFEKELLDINISFKGRIRIINLLIYVIKLYKIDRIREFVSFVKQ